MQREFIPSGRGMEGHATRLAHACMYAAAAVFEVPTNTARGKTNDSQCAQPTGHRDHPIARVRGNAFATRSIHHVTSPNPFVIVATPPNATLHQLPPSFPPLQTFHCLPALTLLSSPHSTSIQNPTGTRSRPKWERTSSSLSPSTVTRQTSET